VTTLATSFEADLREGVLDAVAERARTELTSQLRDGIVDRLEAYGSRHGYDVVGVPAGVEVVVERDTDSIRLRALLPHPALLFERGTAAHEVEARQADVLSFVWSEGGSSADPPQWVREQFDREGDGWRVYLPRVEVAGLPEGRFIRDTLHELRRTLQ